MKRADGRTSSKKKALGCFRTDLDLSDPVPKNKTGLSDNISENEFVSIIFAETGRLISFLSL